jgi:hypothetical protein
MSFLFSRKPFDRLRKIFVGLGLMLVLLGVGLPDARLLVHLLLIVVGLLAVALGVFLRRTPNGPWLEDNFNNPR